MKLRYKFPLIIVLLLILSSLIAALIVSYDANCDQFSQSSNVGANRLMTAVTYDCYGSSEVLQLEQIVRPVPATDEVLVKVKSASVNPLDWHYMRGSPYVMRLMTGVGKPKERLFGSDYAGVVEEVGTDVTRFNVGDHVFGTANGAFAQYLVIKEEKAIAIKPANITFEQAAGVSVAGITALQALRDKGDISAGDKVLINGASGGVGTFAVQIAKAYGAEVTGVSSTRNIEMVLSLGADQMVDYKVKNVIDLTEKFDLIIDNVGNFSPAQYQHLLTDDGAFVLVGGAKGNWIGPFINSIKIYFHKPEKEQTYTGILAQLRQDDLIWLGELMSVGKLVPVVDRTYSLTNVAQAIDYSESGRARGKIIITVE